MPGSKWKRRDPNIFPIRYADTVITAKAIGAPVVLETCTSLVDARAKRDRFREWRFCLRERGGPANRAWAIERDCTISTRMSGLAIMVEVKPRRTALSLLPLNPHLKDIIHAD